MKHGLILLIGNYDRNIRLKKFTLAMSCQTEIFSVANPRHWRLSVQWGPNQGPPFETLGTILLWCLGGFRGPSLGPPVCHQITAQIFVSLQIVKNAIELTTFVWLWNKRNFIWFTIKRKFSVQSLSFQFERKLKFSCISVYYLTWVFFYWRKKKSKLKKNLIFFLD